jgi:hypothetical protein
LLDGENPILKDVPATVVTLAGKIETKDWSTRNGKIFDRWAWVTVTYTIFSMYSFVENADYYIVEQSIYIGNPYL